MRTPNVVHCLTVLLLVSTARGEPKDAVIRMPSHGGSGTVIATGEGWSLILSCAHCFQGGDARKPIALDVPVNWSKAPPKKVGVQLLGVQPADDLALLKLGYGPLPFVAPVAPSGFKPGVCWSVGYDEMALPPQCRPAHVLSVSGNVTWTRERPWHGRSGGGLIDQRTGYLVGVVSGYTGPKNRVEVQPGAQGVYASHPAILRFLASTGYSVPSAPDAIRSFPDLPEHRPDLAPPFPPGRSAPPFAPRLFERRSPFPPPGGT